MDPSVPELPQDVLASMLASLDISLREKCQLQLVCRSFRDALNEPQSSAVWGSCSLGRDFSENVSTEQISI